MKKREFTLWVATLIFALFAMCPIEAHAQRISVRIEQGTLDQAFQEIISESKVQLVYNTNAAKDIRVKAQEFKQQDVSQVLDALLAGTSLTYQLENGIYTIVQKNKSDQQKKTGTVRGRVLDEAGEPVIGASIVLKGTTKGTITDADGKFLLADVTGTVVTLRVSYIGMLTKEENVELNSNITIRMREDASQLGEVIVTGYQDIVKEKMTGSVMTVRADDLNERYTPNIMQNLEGRVAGLTTYNGKTTIRGTSSLYAETNPLLVVDGVPIEGKIEDLNPYDIESVNVLKDAAAAAIYGARAANGVIVITTKNAKKQGKIDIDFSANLTIHEKKNMDYADNFYMTPEQQINSECDYWNYYFFDNDGEIDDPIGSVTTGISYGRSDVSPIQYAYYQLAKGEITQGELDNVLNRLKKNNFAKEFGENILRQQVLQQYNLALRSRSDKSQNSITVNYKYDNSGRINSNENAFNITYKGLFDISDWLTATININGIYTNKKEPGFDYNANFTDPWGFAAYESLYEEDGSDRIFYDFYNGNRYWSSKGTEGLHDLGINTREEHYNNVETTKRQHMRYHGNLLFKIFKGLTANAQFVYETSHTTTEWHANEQSHLSRIIRNTYATNTNGKVTYLTPENGGMLRTTNTDGNYWTARGQLNYNRNFGKHAVAALAGLEFRETKTRGTKSLILGYDEQLQNSATHTVDFGALSMIRRSSYYMAASGGIFADVFVFDPYLRDGMGIVPEVKHRYASGYANLTYTYDEKYNVFGSFRKDYADVYGLNSKFRGKPLWSVGAGWNAHNESFIKDNVDWINFLKLRFSYGVTGNIYQNATSYLTASAGSLNQYTNLPVGKVDSPANPNLKWEQSRTTNIGVDFALLNNRLRGNLDYYWKISKDIFSNRTLDPTTGFTSMFVNTASMENKGIEMQLTYDWLNGHRRQDFTWTTSFTLSHNKNMVTKVENPSTMAYQLQSNPFREGYPASALWSFRFAGISDAEGEQGQTLWYIEDGGKAHVAQRSSVDILEYSGQTDPKIVMGMDHTFRWNGLSLSVLMTYYGGHKMRALEEKETEIGVSYSAIPSYFLNAWTPENPTNTPGYGRYGTTSSSIEPRYSDISVHDADFLKIRNIVLGYDLPEQWLKGIGVNRVSLRFQVDNPKYLWVKNDIGIDPETRGIRTQSAYIFGLNVNL